MYIDSEDIGHIVKNLKLDIPKMAGKLKLMRDNLNKSLKGRSNLKPITQSISWRNPETETQWEIYYLVQKVEKNLTVEFFPLTTITNRHGVKDFFLFYQEDFMKVLMLDGQLIKIFKGHFISRVKERRNIQFDTFDIIFNFLNTDDAFIVDYYQQNEKWLLYLNRLGVAFVKKSILYVSFDTFVTPADLKPDQKEVILKHIDKLYELDKFLYLLGIVDTGLWNDFIDKSRFENSYARFISRYWAEFEKLPVQTRDFIMKYLRIDRNMFNSTNPLQEV